MNLLGWQWNACGLPGWRGSGILKLQIDGCFMFMYKVLFLVGAYLRSDQLVTSHWNSSMLPYKQVMRNEKLIGFRVLSWYTSKFSCLIYKEQHGNQWGELLIGCWEVKGLKLSSNLLEILWCEIMWIGIYSGWLWCKIKLCKCNKCLRMIWELLNSRKRCVSD